MRLLVGDDKLGTYLARVHQSRPHRVELEGTGRNVGKAAWLALILEREAGYHRVGMDLDRVVEEASSDLARLRITLEGCDSGAEPEP